MIVPKLWLQLNLLAPIVLIITVEFLIRKINCYLHKKQNCASPAQKKIFLYCKDVPRIHKISISVKYHFISYTLVAVKVFFMLFSPYCRT